MSVLENFKTRWKSWAMDRCNNQRNTTWNASAVLSVTLVYISFDAKYLMCACVCSKNGDIPETNR